MTSRPAAYLNSEHADAAEAVFGNLHLEYFDKPTVLDADAGTWGTRRVVVTFDRFGLLVNEQFLEPEFTGETL